MVKNASDSTALPRFASIKGRQHRSLRSASAIIFIIAGVCCIFFLSHKADRVKQSKWWTSLNNAEGTTWNDRGRSKYLNSIAVNVKTGITIAGQRVAFRVLTEQARMLPEQTYYADAAFTLGDIKVLDAYSKTSKEIQSQATFQTYFQVQKDLSANHIARGGHDYWALSRYIDTHIQGLSYSRNPDKDWYMTVDDDTFVFWGTLLRWLRHFNPNDQVWLGHYDNNRGTIFANGGSGYIVSRKMMTDTFGSDPEYSTREPELYLMYDAGDTRLGKAFTNHPNMTLKRPSAGDPSMNTERPRWITYSPLTWYLPVLTLGHMDASGNSMARQVEKRIAVEHGREDDIRFCDLYNQYVPAELPELKWKTLNQESLDGKGAAKRWLQKENWRANPRFVHQRVASSIVQCQNMCESAADCYGYLFFTKNTKKNCHVYRLQAFTFGEPHKDVVSAWDLHKIRNTTAKLDCTDVQSRQAGWTKSTTIGLAQAMVT